MIILLQQKSERCWEHPINEFLPCVLEKAQGDYFAWVFAGITALFLGFFVYLIKFYLSPEKMRKNRELLLIYKQSMQEVFELSYFSTTRILWNRKLKKEIIFYSRLNEQEAILRQLLKRRKVDEEKIKKFDEFFRTLINGLRNTSTFKDKAEELEKQIINFESKLIISARDVLPFNSNQNRGISPIISIKNEHWKNLLRDVFHTEIPKQIISIDSIKPDEVINNLKKKSPFMSRIGSRSPFNKLLSL